MSEFKIKESEIIPPSMSIDEIIIEYRRGNEISTTDAISIEFCEELITKIKELVNYNTSKANIIKIIDNLLYLTIHSLSFTIFVLGLYNGSANINSDSSIESTSKWFFINSILTGISIFLTEISKRYNFNSRSIEIYKCVQEIQIYILEIEELKISPISPNEKIDKLKNIELMIQPILMRIFKHQIDENQKTLKLTTRQIDNTSI